MTVDADRHLLFGLLALQNGIINQGQLVAAFQAWTLDKSKGLADHLEFRGDLTGARRAVLEALAVKEPRAAIYRSKLAYSLRRREMARRTRRRGGSAADAGPHLAKAAALLARAVEMGYRNPDVYRTESALDPLRHREDFKKLLQEVGNSSPAQPEKKP